MRDYRFDLGFYHILIFLMGKLYFHNPFIYWCPWKSYQKGNQLKFYRFFYGGYKISTIFFLYKIFIRGQEKCNQTPTQLLNNLKALKNITWDFRISQRKRNTKIIQISISVLCNLQYFTQFGHMAELSESELVLQKPTNSQTKQRFLYGQIG